MILKIFMSINKTESEGWVYLHPNSWAIATNDSKNHAEMYQKNATNHFITLSYVIPYYVSIKLAYAKHSWIYFSFILCDQHSIPADTYLFHVNWGNTNIMSSMFKVNNENTRTTPNRQNTKIMNEICSKLTIQIPQRPHWRHSGVFIVNTEQISHIVLMMLLLILNECRLD